MLKKIVLALAALAAALTLIWAYYGGFASPAPITRDAAGPFHLAYIRHVGPYKKIGDSLQKLRIEIEKAGISNYRMGGQFYDDPKVVEATACRSDAVALLNANDLEKLKNHASIKTKTIERRVYLTTTFPYRGKLSTLAGIIKVYPLYAQYFRDNALAPFVYKKENFEDTYGMEIYGPKQIFYYMTFQKKENP